MADQPQAFGRGRVTNRKFTGGKQRAIIKALKGGAYAKAAAEQNGIDESTYYRWLQRGEAALEAEAAHLEAEQADEAQMAPPLPDKRELEYARFVEKVRAAETQAEAEALEKIRGADDWRAQAWFLERRQPGRWAKRENVDVTTKGQPIRTVVVTRTVREGDGE